MQITSVRVREFQAGDEAAFRELNEWWIEKFFTIEPKDRETLDDPVGKILRPGGAILMAFDGSEPAGCCALLNRGEGNYEVAKMAVSPNRQGQGIGRQVLGAVIEHARQLGATRLYLETNHRLHNAIHLYESLGFRHVPPEQIVPSPYARADVYMEMEVRHCTMGA